MVYDRTQLDIDRSAEILKKYQSGGDLTSADNKQLSRGTLTPFVLNRIEDKIVELKNLLEEDFYFVGKTESKLWGYENYFKQSDFNRILDNIAKLKEAYFIHKDTPEIPDNNYFRYQTINAVEYLLNDIDVMISEVKSYYRECGAYECREEV